MDPKAVPKAEGKNSYWDDSPYLTGIGVSDRAKVYRMLTLDLSKRELQEGQISN